MNTNTNTNTSHQQNPDSGAPELPACTIYIEDGKAELMARPAFRPSADWTKLLRPADAPPPAWAKSLTANSAPPQGSGQASAEKTSTSTTTSTAPLFTEPCDGDEAVETSANSANSAGGGPNTRAEPAAPEADFRGQPDADTPPKRSREHPIPEDSILADYRDFVREVSELPDALIVAPILTLCGKLLTPNVTLDFGGTKPLTMYNFITTPAGMRKSTTFSPAEKIARQVLMNDEFISGNASDSALFDTFETQPHRVQFEDEGNTILRSWESNSYGREVSARYLRLYDGAPWDQNFLREMKNHGDGNASRHIPQATLSLCIGSTFGVARLDQLEAGSGLRRRFGFYLATKQARTILWPRTLEGAELEHLADLFHHLTRLKGTVGKANLTPAAMEYWTGLQQRNRERCMKIPGYTSAGEDLLSSLNESPARCLKLAVIFQACRWAKGSTEHPFTITPEILEMAEAHQNACLDALVELESIGRRTHIEDAAEWLLSQIAGDHAGRNSATYTRTELTRRFASNPGRAGALTPSKIYGEIIPRLIAMKRCHQASKIGKQVTYAFCWK